jgi:hypothetical protein
MYNFCGGENFFGSKLYDRCRREPVMLLIIYFDTDRTEQIENYISDRWDTEVLGSFETAQKGGWGTTATLSVTLDKLGFEAKDETLLYAVIYDTNAKKWYQVRAEVMDGKVVIKTKRSGIITIVTDSVK